MSRALTRVADMEFTVRAHLSETVKQRRKKENNISNRARGSNEVRRHIKFGMLSLKVIQLARSAHGGMAPQ